MCQQTQHSPPANTGFSYTGGHSAVSTETIVSLSMLQVRAIIPMHTHPVFVMNVKINVWNKWFAVPGCGTHTHTQHTSLTSHLSHLCRIIAHNNRAGSQQHLAISNSPTLALASTYTLRQRETHTHSLWAYTVQSCRSFTVNSTQIHLLKKRKLFSCFLPLSHQQMRGISALEHWHKEMELTIGLLCHNMDANTPTHLHKHTKQKTQHYVCFSRALCERLLYLHDCQNI